MNESTPLAIRRVGEAIYRNEFGIDIEGTLRELNKHSFKKWPVQELIECPQTKIYKGARTILASRVGPYLGELLQVMSKFDIRLDKYRIEFVVETMDNEIAEVVESMPIEDKIKDVLEVYFMSAKKLRSQLIENDKVGHDFALALAAAAKMQVDILDLFGLEMIPLEPGATHPLAHAKPALPGVL